MLRALLRRIRKWTNARHLSKERAAARAELWAMAPEQLDDLGIARWQIDAYLDGRVLPNGPLQRDHAPNGERHSQNLRDRPTPMSTPPQAPKRPALRVAWTAQALGDCCDPTCCPDRRAA